MLLVVTVPAPKRLNTDMTRSSWLYMVSGLSFSCGEVWWAGIQCCLADNSRLQPLRSPSTFSALSRKQSM